MKQLFLSLGLFVLALPEACGSSWAWWDQIWATAVTYTTVAAMLDPLHQDRAGTHTSVATQAGRAIEPVPQHWSEPPQRQCWIFNHLVHSGKSKKQLFSNLANISFRVVDILMIYLTAPLSQKKAWCDRPSHDPPTESTFQLPEPMNT